MQDVKPRDESAHEVEDGQHVPLFKTENLPDLENFGEYRKTATTWAARVNGPFATETSESESEPLVCEDGWLAVDSEGSPYPISASVFAETYEPAIPDELDAELPDAEVAGEGAIASDLTPAEAERTTPSVPIGGGEADVAMLIQLSNRLTYMEAVFTALATQLVAQNLLPREYVSDLTREGDKRLTELADRSTTPGRSRLIGAELRSAA